MRIPARLRLPVAALLPLVAALVAQAAYTFVSQREAVDDGLTEEASALATLMVNVTGPSLAFDDTKAIDEELGYVSRESEFAFAAVLGPDGHPVAVRRSGVAEATVSGLLRAAPEPRIVRDGDHLVAAAPIVTDGHQIGTVLVGLRTDDAHASVMGRAAWGALISLVGIAIAVVVVQVLARKIARRNEQMRIVLDNVEEALATVKVDGSLESECSAAFVRWFGAPRAEPFWAQLAGDDVRLREMLALAWSEIVDGVMPIELLVDQFPSKLERDGHHFRIGVKPLFAGEVLTGALLRIRDVTAEVGAERMLAAQREYVAVFERALADPHGVREFIEDTGKLVADLPIATDPVIAKRAMHTIKGNAAVFGVASVAEVAHQLEDRLLDDGPADAASVQELVAVWTAFANRVEHLLGARRDHIEIERAELEALASLAERGGAIAAERLRALLLETAEVRFTGFRRQIGCVASRLGKPEPAVEIDANGVRLSPERFRAFWGVFSHMIRNALDHGIESAGEREAAGKAAEGRIELRARSEDGQLRIELADDGRGIAWDRVRDRATALGLPAEQHADLERALFQDGLSTADGVSETSGRGIGLAVVDATVRDLGGHIAVASEPGRGTRFTFIFPDPRSTRPAALAS